MQNQSKKRGKGPALHCRSTYYGVRWFYVGDADFRALIKTAELPFRIKSGANTSSSSCNRAKKNQSTRLAEPIIKTNIAKRVLENKMNSPEIERLISEAINNRPKATTAPMNLYIYDSKLLCGARIVMPQDAKFVAYVPPNCLEQGFNDKEWQLIVQKVNQVTNSQYPDDNKPKEISEIQQFRQKRFSLRHPLDNERRREPRLYYRRPMWYSESSNKTRYKGQMVDISSCGMAFTCCVPEQNPLVIRQQITTRLDVPLFGTDSNYDMVKFDRVGRICRIEKVNSSIHRIALQFSKPLPFKPAEQGLPNTVMEQKLATK